MGAAALVAVAKAKISRADLAFTGLADTPFLAKTARLVGTARDQAGDVIAQVAEAALVGVEANEDIHASAEYRIHLAQLAARRALAGALARAT